MANTLRIVPVGGGPGMVTNNMYVYEWGNDAIIVDCGIGFPDDKVSDDITIPDISYLKEKRLNIRGVVLTHGHDDHMAALPHILPQIGFTPVYGSALTAGFAEDRLNNFDINQKIHVFKETDRLTLGPFTIDPVFVTHSVPDTYHLAIGTPLGLIYHGSDFKFDLTPIDGRRPNFKKIVTVAKNGVLCLLSDSLRSERAGFTPSESTLTIAIDRELRNCPGRLIFTTMSSQIHRIQQAIDVAYAHGRQVMFIGRSMERNVATARRLGYLKMSQKQEANKKNFNKIPDHQICLIVAGSQGQESSSLTRYASGTHKMIKIRPNDKIIYSTDIIPGNEQLVYEVIDQLTKQNLIVVYGDLADDLHVSGHASAGEMQLLMELTDPQYLYPIGGSFRHLNRYRQLALGQGFRGDQVIIPKTAQVVEFDSSGHYRLGEVLALKPVRLNQNSSYNNGYGKKKKFKGQKKTSF